MKGLKHGYFSNCKYFHFWDIKNNDVDRIRIIGLIVERQRKDGLKLMVNDLRDLMKDNMIFKTIYLRPPLSLRFRRRVNFFRM